MWQLDHKEGWAPKNWCFQIAVLEKTLECFLDGKITPVNPKENQSWMFIGRTDTEAETPILRPPDAKSWLIWKDSEVGKDRRQEKGMTEDEMAGWHHQLHRHEFKWIPGVDDGQGGLVCCSPWACKESHKIEWLNWNDIQKAVIKMVKLVTGTYTFFSLLWVVVDFIMGSQEKE